MSEDFLEAEAFLEDCMAVVVESLAEVREYFEENGMDVDGCQRKNWKRLLKCLHCRMVLI